METLTLDQAEPAAAAGTMWRIDPAHSTIGFSIKHMKIATVHGRFAGFGGTIQFDGDRPWDAEVEAEIDAATIDTGIAKRDNHLRSADFFDVAKYPTIAFRSRRVRPATPRGPNRFHVIGNLTIHGVTQEVDLDVELIGRQGGGIAFEASAKINRKDFGMTFNLPIEGGGLVVGDEVRIAITVRAQRTAP